MLMAVLSLPQTVMRMSGSVPEGRTRRRPWTVLRLSLYSSMIFWAGWVFRASFWSVVAVMLTVIWGNLVMLLVSSPSDLCVSETILASMREVRMPSPVGSPGRIICPDCSPPSLMCSLSIAAFTLESPTEVTSTLMPFFLAQFNNP